MTKKRTRKVLALGAVVALCLSLTACYVPPDDDNSVAVGNNNKPWSQYDMATAIPTEAPTPTPTIVPQTTSTSPTDNWNWGSAATDSVSTNTLQPQQTVGGGVATNPVVGLTAPTAKPATQTINVIAPPTRTPSANATATGSLKMGSSGDDVRTVQRLLRNLGYYTGSVDGDYGEATQKAVIAFQRANGLEVDGKVGAATLAKLNSSSAISYKQSIATATPTGSLKNGSSGNDVRTVQRLLRSLGYYTGTVDGDFGDATEAAVIAFQRANGLTADGKVGDATLAALNSSSAVSYKQSIATATPSSLQQGSSGTDVSAVQRRLKQLGYYNGSVDGKFGATTEAAVISFQRANGLTADGKVGEATLAVLNSGSALTYNQAYATATPKPTATPRTNIYLEVGSTGDNVKKLQNRLIELGYLSGTADGTYGGATETAVRAFQARTTGLYEDGKAGPLTLEALYSSSARAASTVAASVGETLELGAQGNAVKALQKRLRALGYLSDSADGSYGANTVAAVAAFQQANGLKADGKAGAKTLNAIYASDASSASAAATPQSTARPSVDDDDVTTTGYTTLRRGDEGNAVTTLQQALKNAGYYVGHVDGVYGIGTVDAVKAFQEAMDLKVDGVAGPATQRALYNTSGSSIEYATLRPGDSSTAVRNMQYTLYELGYYDGNVDGVYGTTTSEAVRAFQIRNNISPVDGVAGNKTLQVLYSSSAISATKKDTTFTTLRLGDYGEEVLEMKQALDELGYTVTMDTNIFDDQTRAAVLLFQQYNGLKVDGVAGNDTQTKLYSGTAVRNPQ